MLLHFPIRSYYCHYFVWSHSFIFTLIFTLSVALCFFLFPSGIVFVLPEEIPSVIFRSSLFQFLVV